MTDKASGEVTVLITLGSGNEFGISDRGLFLTNNASEHYEEDMTIDLGPSTKANFNRLISNMKRLECHLEE